MKIEKLAGEVLSNPVAFSIAFLHLKPFDYQAKFLMDLNKKQVVRTGRQTGKSTMAAVKALWYAITNKEWSILILAPTWRQSGLLFLKVREMIAKNILLSQLLISETRTQVRFKNGSIIYCLPAGRTGETIRGFTANVIIVDESAYVPEAVFTAVEPALATTGGILILLSTPADNDGRFWTACQDNEWSMHHVPSSASPLIDKSFLDGKKLELTDMEFTREFLGEFTEEEDDKLIRQKDIWWSKENTPSDKWKPTKLTLGVDIARFGRDENVAVLVETDHDIFNVKNIWAWSQTDLMTTAGRIIGILEEVKPDHVQVDDSGLGGGVTDRLREQGHDITAINFGSGALEPEFLNIKAEMFWNLRRLFEKNKLFIPDNTKLVNYLNRIRYDRSSNGKIKILDGKRKTESQTIKKSPDHVDALALACYLRFGGYTVLRRGFG